MGLKFYFEMKDTHTILSERGLDDFGRAQKALDSEVLRYADPYVPFRTGMLKDSGISGTVLGSGVVVYNSPYAKKQYYNGRIAGTSRSGVSRLRGRYWIERMKADHIEDLRRVVAAFGNK